MHLVFILVKQVTQGKTVLFLLAQDYYHLMTLIILQSSKFHVLIKVFVQPMVVNVIRIGVGKIVQFLKTIIVKES